MSYIEIRESIKTGDIVAFEGSEYASSVIKHFLKDKISHIGICVWLDKVAPGITDRLMIVESTTLNKVPDITGEYRRGIQMIPMSQRIDGLGAKEHAWLFPLETPIEPSKELEMMSWLFSAHSSRIPYDTYQAIKSALDPEKWIFPFNYLKNFLTAEEDMTRLFCSELCAKALQHADKLDPEFNPSEMTPQDVLKLSCLNLNQMRVLK